MRYSHLKFEVQVNIGALCQARILEYIDVLKPALPKLVNASSKSNKKQQFYCIQNIGSF